MAKNNSSSWLSILIATVIVTVGVWALLRGGLQSSRSPTKDRVSTAPTETPLKDHPAKPAIPSTAPMEPPPAAPAPAFVSVPVAPVGQDPIAWLLDHKDHAPKEVALAREVEFPVVIQGKVSGSAMVPAGTVVELVELARDQVGIVYRGGGARVPVAATDLESRADAAMKKFASSKAPLVSLVSAKPATPVTAAATSFPAAGRLLPVTISGSSPATTALLKSRVILAGTAQFHITGAGDPLDGSVLNFTSPDAWLFLDKIRASEAIARFHNRIWVNGVPAEIDSNLRIAEFGPGCVIIPHGHDFAAMSVYGGQSLVGSLRELKCFTNYDAVGLGSIRSFRLKRGYMATIAEKEDGTGVSRNYVAQDSDIEVKNLPRELDGNVRFVRIFPWRFTSKKGIAGGIWQNLNVGWFYDWNIGAKSSPEIEYVPIRQKRWWPGLKQDWRVKGAAASEHLWVPVQWTSQGSRTVRSAVLGA